MLQFVVMDNRYERMQYGRTNVAGVVVDVVNLQYFGFRPRLLTFYRIDESTILFFLHRIILHYNCKDTHFFYYQ